MNQYERKIGQAAIKTFGRIPNIIKTIEELSELQQALCKHIVSERDAMTVASVHEEIADVQIMLGRLMMLFDPTEVQDWRDSKLEMMAKLLGLEDEEEEEEEKEKTSSVTAAPCHLPKPGNAFEELDRLCNMTSHACEILCKGIYEAVSPLMRRPPEGESERDKCQRHGPCAVCEGPEEPTGDALEEMRL